MSSSLEALALHMLEAHDGYEAITLLEAEEPGLALECALALVRHTVEIVPPRPRVFVNDEAERQWNDDGARVTRALDWAARRVARGRSAEPTVPDEEHTRSLAECEALHAEIADAADAYDYDPGCGTVHTVTTLLEVIHAGAALDRVVRVAARVLATPDDPVEPMSTDAAAMKAARERKLRHRSRALRPLLARWLLEARRPADDDEQESPRSS